MHFPAEALKPRARGDAAFNVAAAWKPSKRSGATPALASRLALVVPMDGVFMSHRNTAGLAKLLALGFHALGDFFNVRDEVGAQSHRIGCASLALLRRALSMGTGQTDEQQTERQRQQPCETHCARHTLFPFCEDGLPQRAGHPRASSAKGETGCPKSVRRGEKLRRQVDSSGGKRVVVKGKRAGAFRAAGVRSSVR